MSYQSEKHGQRSVDGNQSRIVDAADHRADPFAAGSLRFVNLDLRGSIQAAFRTDADPQKRRFDKVAGDRQNRNRGVLSE